MPLMKGSAFTARFDYLKKKFPSQWGEYLAALSPATRDLATSNLLKSAWYPFESFVDLNLRADRLMGRGDLALVKELGRYASEANLPTLYKLFYRVGSPEYLLNKAAALWRVHHDTGEARFVLVDPNHAEYQIHNFGAPNVVLCRSLEGFLEKSLELMAMKQISIIEKQCALHGARFCCFVGRWSPRS